MVYLNQLATKNQELYGQLEKEKVIFDRTLARIQEKLEEYRLLFSIFQRNIDDLFYNLIQASNKVANQKISFFEVAKRRLSNEDDLVEEKLITALNEVQLDKNLQEIFQEATATFLQYRDRILKEATEDIETVSYTHLRAHETSLPSRMPSSA